MDKKELSFEDAMKELSVITEKLQSSATTLEDSLKLFEEGTEMVRICYDKLKNAEIKITKLTEEYEEE